MTEIWFFEVWSKMARAKYIYDYIRQNFRGSTFFFFLCKTTRKALLVLKFWSKSEGYSYNLGWFVLEWLIYSSKRFLERSCLLHSNIFQILGDGDLPQRPQWKIWMEPRWNLLKVLDIQCWFFLNKFFSMVKTCFLSWVKTFM